MLKSRTTWPPGGFRFRDAKTGLVLTGVLDFKSSVFKIIEARKANPRFGLPVDFDTVANELDAYCCKSMKIPNDPNYCVQGGGANFPKGLSASGHLTVPARLVGSAVADVSRFARNTKAGIGLYLEYFGTGAPVDKALATKRAEICITCPHNEPANLAERFSQVVANQIGMVMGILKDLDLKTGMEDKLHVCKICSCPLSAKQFAPLPIILKHIRPETFAELPDFCWMRTES